jgi:hypothetical protein
VIDALGRLVVAGYGERLLAGYPLQIG